MMRIVAALLVLCAAPIGVGAAPHRAKTTAKHAAAPKPKRASAARQAKTAHVAAARSADEPEVKPEHKDPKPEVEHAKGAAVSQADDSEDPPVRQRAK